MNAAIAHFGALPSITALPLSEGDSGTEETIAYIRQLVDQGVKDPAINRTAIGILHAARIRAFDLSGEVRAVYDWVLRNIRFTRDIAGKETLRSARETLTVRAGDCDDINGILLPSLLGTIGHRVRLVTISAHPVSPNFSHIYAEVQLNGRWIAVDAARRDAAFGRGPARYSRKRVWSINSDDYTDVAGMRGLGFYAPRGMGDFDWGSFIPNVTKAVTGVISAVRTPSYILPYQTALAPSGQTLTPGQVPQYAAQSQMPAWLLPAGLGLAALMLLKGK